MANNLARQFRHLARISLWTAKINQKSKINLTLEFTLTHITPKGIRVEKTPHV